MILLLRLIYTLFTERLNNLILISSWYIESIILKCLAIICLKECLLKSYERLVLVNLKYLFKSWERNIRESKKQQRKAKLGIMDFCADLSIRKFYNS